MSSAGAGALDHTAVVHRGAGELADVMAEPLRGAVARGEAVLVSLVPDAWAPLQRALGPAAAPDVRWMDARDRYATPAGAMARLHRFVTAAVDRGAPAVWSLGALGLDGSAADAPWLRYEHAVNDVLGDLPLHAVCAFDRDVTPPAALEHALAAHGPDAAALHEHAALPPAPPLDDLLVDEVVASAEAARDLVGALAEGVPAAALDDLRLVVSELVTNAFRYGRPPVRLAMGRRDGALLVRVHDTGAGIADPYADLRPPHPEGDGGRGLNIVAQLGRLHFDPGAATVTAVVDLP